MEARISFHPLTWSHAPGPSLGDSWQGLRWQTDYMTFLVSESLRESLSAPTAAMAGHQGTFSLWESLSPAMAIVTQAMKLKTEHGGGGFPWRPLLSPALLAAICSGCHPHPGLTQPWTLPEKAGAVSLPEVLSNWAMESRLYSQSTNISERGFRPGSSGAFSSYD